MYVQHHRHWIIDTHKRGFQLSGLLYPCTTSYIAMSNLKRPTPGLARNPVMFGFFSKKLALTAVPLAVLMSPPSHKTAVPLAVTNNPSPWSSRFPVLLSNRRDTVFLAIIFSAFLAANGVAKYTDCKLSDVA